MSYSEYLISVPTADVPDPLPDNSQIIEMTGYTGHRVFSDPRKDGNPISEWPVTSILLGQWDPDGTPQSIHVDYQLWRPLGNDAGYATGDLTGQGRQGWAYRYQAIIVDPDPDVPDVGSIYPMNHLPFKLKITREDHTSDPTWPGWGWRVDMISEDPARDITARAIGIYTVSWVYQYTTGAFVDDGSGNFYTECPIGQRTADPDPVYFALLLGAAQEGRWVLTGDTSQSQFWSSDQ